MNMETKIVFFHFKQFFPIHSFHDFRKWQVKLRQWIYILSIL